jgi:hypothetical protein
VAKLKLFLVVLALILNGIFLFLYDATQFFAISQLHGQVGYNLVCYNSCNINSKLTTYCGQLQQQQNCLIDYAEIKNINFGFPQEIFPINDTIGYGVVLGLLWKLTNSFRFLDIQFLQIIIYTIVLLLYYQTCLLLFGDSFTAFLCSVVQLFFFPLLWLNVQPVRDIWAYYGSVILLYGIVQFLFSFKQPKSWIIIALCGALFSICQYIRPSAFLVLITLSAVSFLYAMYTKQTKKIICMLIIIWFMNILFFWLPFAAYNMRAYNRFFVGPVGQDLLEGLGEFENPWNYHLCDRWLASYIGEKYHVKYGTPEFDDAAKQEFDAAFKENPLFYIRAIVKRIPRIILPALPWIYDTNDSWKLVLSKWYMRLFLIFGYIACLYALLQKRFFVLALTVAILLAGLGKLPSHIEYRYLIPFYWVFSLPIGLLLIRFVKFFSYFVADNFFVKYFF